MTTHFPLSADFLLFFRQLSTTIQIFDYRLEIFVLNLQKPCNKSVSLIYSADILNERNESQKRKWEKSSCLFADRQKKGNR